MSDDIAKSLSPFLTISRLIGIGIFESPVGQRKSYIVYLCFLSMWTFYGVTVYTTFLEIYKTLGLLFCFTYYLNAISAFVSTVFNILNNKKFHTCLWKLAVVDDTLKEIGTPTDYRKIYRSSFRMAFLWLSCSLVSISLGCCWWYLVFKMLSKILFLCVISLPVHLNTIVDLMTVMIVRHLDLELRNISRALNETFDVQLTLQMTSNFPLIVEIIPGLYHSTVFQIKSHTIYSFFTIFLSFTWSALCLSKLLIINHICEKLANEAKRTKELLCKLANSDSECELHDEILQFSLQVMQRPLKFSAMGFYDFGYNFIRQFFSWILTCIIILIQTNSF